MVHNPPAWRFVVFNIGGDDALLLGLAPNPVMPPRMGQVIAIRLGPAERSAIDEQLAVDQPEDADPGLRPSSRCVAPSGFVRFAHWLAKAAGNSDVRRCKSDDDLGPQSDSNLAQSPIISGSWQKAILAENPVVYSSPPMRTWPDLPSLSLATLPK